MENKAVFSVLEAARYLGIGKSTLYVVLQEGRIPVRKLGTRALIKREDLDRFLDALPQTTLAQTKQDIADNEDDGA